MWLERCRVLADALTRLPFAEPNAQSSCPFHRISLLFLYGHRCDDTVPLLSVTHAVSQVRGIFGIIKSLGEED